MELYGKHSWEMTALPAVILSDETFQEIFWNCITDEFTKEILPGKWIVFFQEGRDIEAKEWARNNKGMFIRTHESLIKHRITRFERENPEFIKDLLKDMISGLRDLFLFGDTTMGKTRIIVR
jgi:hypothetical protein